MNFKHTFFAVCVFCTLLSCGENPENPVPDLAVGFSVNIAFAQYAALQSPGGHAFLTGGVYGVFVYRSDSQTFFAYDRCCPGGRGHSPLVYDEKSKCMHHSDTLKDCNSRFSVLLHGAVVKGDSKFPLKEYSAVLGGSTLRISNY